MSEFENMSLVDLRKMLVDTIIKVMGRDYALGWLHSAYSYDMHAMDKTRTGLIEQILEIRSRHV